MDIPQTVQFVDEAVCTKTGKRLNDLQRRIIAGILKNQKYADVAETHGYSDKHVKKVSHELLQMLSDIFGEQVKKSNLESVLERHINLTISFGDENKINQNLIGIGYINSCPASSTPILEKSQPKNPDLHGNNQANFEKIGKLRQFGLSDEQIAEVLELPLDVVKLVDFQE